jgi:C4-type Zn-finger protein
LQLIYMPLLDIHNLLTGATAKHLNCPHCGGDMQVKEEKQRLGFWCRLLLRTPNIHCYYHCGTCGWHYGLVKLAEDKHEPF